MKGIIYDGDHLGSSQKLLFLGFDSKDGLNTLSTLLHRIKLIAMLFNRPIHMIYIALYYSVVVILMKCVNSSLLCSQIDS